MRKKFYIKQIAVILIAAVILAFICFLPKIVLHSVFSGSSENVKYELSSPVDDVVKIELFYVSPYGSRNIEELEALNSLVIIEEAEHASFLKEFMDLPCVMQGIDPLQGIAYYSIKITYKNSSVEWVGHYSGLYCNAETQQKKWKHYYFEKELFEEFISQYLPEDLGVSK